MYLPPNKPWANILTSLSMILATGLSNPVQAYFPDLIQVKILSVECQTHITLDPLSSHTPTYRVRGMIVVPQPHQHHAVYVSINPQHVLLSSQHSELPVALSGYIGNTPVQVGQEFPVETTGPVIPIDITGTPTLFSLNSPLAAGFYLGNFTVSARLGN